MYIDLKYEQLFWRFKRDKQTMNRFGRLFTVEIFGESHGPSVGVIIDGCPAGVNISTTNMYQDLLRRKGGYKGTTNRVETDKPVIKSHKIYCWFESIKIVPIKPKRVNKTPITAKTSLLFFSFTIILKSTKSNL